MNNCLKYVAIFSLSCLLFVSCRPDKKDDFSLPFTKETVEEGKTKLADAGQGLLTEMNTLEDIDGIYTVNAFIDCLNSASPFASPSKSASLLAPIMNTNKLSDVATAFNTLLAGLKGDEDTTLQQAFDSNTGIYTWNISLKKWDKSLATDRIEFRFPGTKTGTTDNAKCIMVYHTKPGRSVIIPSYYYGMPTAYNISLYVNENKVAEYDWQATYNSDNIPTNITYFLALYPFKFEYTLNYSASGVSLKYSFTDNAKVIAECYAAVNGNLDKQHIEDVSNNNGNPEEIVDNANAYFQLFNMKLAGKINYKALAEAMRTIDENTSLTQEQAAKAMVDEINKSAILVLINTDTKEKLAQAEAYYSSTDQNVALRFIFADGSKGDLKSYFSQGFQDLVNSVNTFIIEINTDFATNIQPVQYPPK